MYHQKNKSEIEPAAVSESTWTWREDKMFETALVNFPEGTVDRWQKIADAVPGKTAEQVRAHYEVLVHDVAEIEAGRVELPNYPDDAGDESYLGWDSELRNHISFGTGKGSKHGEGERKKGTPWTEEEHRKFLEGLEKYGKGDWRSISRNSVITRTPTQVASHAQKYFQRQSSVRKERKRSSIHDITTTDTTMVVQPPPPTNFYGGQGAGRGGASAQMGYEYQQDFGYPI